MNLSNISVSDVITTAADCGTITSGMVGATVTIRYTDSLWENLKKTVVFSAGLVTRDVPDAAETVEVPHEVLKHPGHQLMVGVYGYDDAGNLVIPTTMVPIGMIRQGADPSGDERTDPTLPVWVKLQEEVAALKVIGEDGGYYQPEITQIDGQTLEFQFVPSKDDMPVAEGIRFHLTPEVDSSEIRELEDSKAPVVTCHAEGVFASIDNAADGSFLGFRLFGKTVQNGVPTVAEPVNLVSTGDDGSIHIALSGKNLLGFEHLSVTARVVISLPVPLPPGVYTIRGVVSSNDPVADSCLAGFLNKDESMKVYATMHRDRDYSCTVTVHEPVDKLWLYSSSSYNGSKGYTAQWNQVRIEWGTQAGAYEPMVRQITAVQTSGGLAGIPVRSGGTYKDVFGQQWICDEIDVTRGKHIQRIGRIESYAGQRIIGEYMSTTGSLSQGATVYYILDEPVETDLTAEELEAFRQIRTSSAGTVVYNSGGAHMELRYIADTEKFVQDELAGISPDMMVKPVETVWEQRFLERIDQMMIPTVALRKMAIAPNGHTVAGTVMTGVNYSSMGRPDEGERLAGIQIPLSTYYSAVENPASRMYTEDLYQDIKSDSKNKAKSTYYGMNCSGFVSYVCGLGEYVWTDEMVDRYYDQVIWGVETENDLFQIRRGDILLNTVESSDDGAHVMVVQDVVCHRLTGKVLGFNITDSWKPYVRCRFMNLQQTLALFYESQPYRLIRLDQSTCSLDVPEIKYSKSLYPDLGDGGKYAVGESVWLYIPNPDVTSITCVKAGVQNNVPLSDMNSDFVNGVRVYEFVTTGAGTYTLATDVSPNDGCKILVV